MSASASLTISAPPHEVWEVVTDFARYPEWDSGVLEIEGSANPGGIVRMRSELSADRMVRMRVTEVEEPHRLVLVGGLPLKLFRAERVFDIEPTKKGSRLTVTETAGGLLRPFVRVPPNVEASFMAYCFGLQKEVKRRRRR